MEIDNRDPSTTWIATTIEVDPGELMGNMIENCYNDDMLFLFTVFQQFMEQDLEFHIDNDEDIKDTRHDYIESFRDYLTGMIENRPETQGR